MSTVEETGETIQAIWISQKVIFALAQQLMESTVCCTQPFKNSSGKSIPQAPPLKQLKHFSISSCSLSALKKAQLLGAVRLGNQMILFGDRPVC